jgi:hypothetical protein
MSQNILKAAGPPQVQRTALSDSSTKRSLVAGGITPMKAAMLRNIYKVYGAHEIYLLKCALYAVINNT